MTFQIDEYRLIEYGANGLEFKEVAKDLGTRALPCYCDFGFIVAFVGQPGVDQRVTVEVLDTAEQPLLSYTRAIRETGIHLVGRAEIRLDTVTLREPGTYTVRAWLGESIVFTKRLTLARACPPLS